MIKRDRLALFLGATMTFGVLANSNAAAGEHSSAPEVVLQEIGLTVTSYKYEEKDFMSLKATKVGIDYSAKFPLSSGWFVKGDLRYATGDADYDSNGSGSSKGKTDWYAEWRLTSGYDFAFGSHTLSPYLGFGYRYLYNDLRGLSSTGSVGYQRESRYVYLPVGLRYAMAFTEQSRLVTTLEYDHLLQGRQQTSLSDTVGYYGWTSVGDITNKQRHGHGLRFSSVFQTRNWSFGPYAIYWKIADSEVATNESTNSALPGYIIIRSWIEPENTTREAGVKVSYLF